MSVSEVAANLMDRRRERELDELFPSVDPKHKVVGGRILVQLRRPKTKTAGGIILAEYTKETQQDVNQTAKLVAEGAGAWKNRTTFAPWPEGPWARPGEFISVPRYGGHRIKVKHPTEQGEFVEFAIFNDYEVICVVEDPLEAIAHVG